MQQVLHEEAVRAETSPSLEATEAVAAFLQFHRHRSPVATSRSHLHRDTDPVEVVAAVEVTAAVPVDPVVAAVAEVEAPEVRPRFPVDPVAAVLPQQRQPPSI